MAPLDTLCVPVILCYSSEMETRGVETKIISHYTMGDAKERIFSALDLHRAAPGSVSVEALFPVDQLHHGGVALTEQMANVAGMKPNMKVLDAGSGIGGSARFLAHKFNCDIETVDLSEEYIRTATALDELVGLSEKVSHNVGSVTEMPFDDDTFDVVWSQNVTMNVPDKKAMFSEAKRVLRRNGVFVLTHIGRSNDAPLDYPVPWAMTEETCFAMSPEDLLLTLSNAGFGCVTDHAAGVPAAPPPPLPLGQPDDSLVMGNDMPQRRANSGKAVTDGRLVPMMVTARRG